MAAGLRAGVGADGLNPDRFFDPDPSIRRVARALYEDTRGLPIVSPHGHVDPRILADNEPFPEPASLIVQPDHYILRLLYANGVPLESLLQGDPRRVWQLFAGRYYLFRGTPTGAWFDYELHEVFGVREQLSSETAAHIYDEIVEKLAAPEFRPRVLFERFNIEVLATTDAATDRLEHHCAIRESGWKGRVIPTFRPDALFRISSPEWPAALDGLGRVRDYVGFVRALVERRKYFKQLGATATDHGVLEPYTALLPEEEAERLFQRARRGDATPDDERRFTAHLLMEMARASLADGLVMQIHAGALRNHNQAVFERFGPDKGGDIPVATEFTRNLRPLLNASCFLRWTNRRTAASSRRSRATTPRCASAPRGGSTIRWKGCGGFASRQPKRPRSTRLRGSTTTRALSAPFRRGTTSRGAWRPIISAVWWRAT